MRPPANAAARHVTQTHDLSRASDQEVVKLAKRRRQDACREIVRRYHRPVYRCIYRMVRHRERAEDLTQHTFFKLFKTLRTFRPDHQLSPWLLTIAANAGHDYVQLKRLDTVTLDSGIHGFTPEDIARWYGADEADAPEPATPPGPDEEDILRRAIDEAAGHLTGLQRLCFVLRYREGRSYREIAEGLKLPLGTVKSYTHRAKKHVEPTLSQLLSSMRQAPAPPPV